VTTLLGTGRPGHADGPFRAAELFDPEGVSAAGTRLYVADTSNHAVRVSDLAGGGRADRGGAGGVRTVAARGV